MDVYVDNVGKYIVKKYRVHSERNNSPTVVSAVINIELQQNEASTKNIEFIENLKPHHWQGNLTEEAINLVLVAGFNIVRTGVSTPLPPP